jgi:hypothetical protein
VVGGKVVVTWESMAEKEERKWGKGVEKNQAVRETVTRNHCIVAGRTIGILVVKGGRIFIYS